MNHKSRLSKIFSMLMLQVFALGTLGSLPARASQTGPEEAPPARLSSDDWMQIQDLLRGTLPSQQAYLKASNTGASDYFGTSIAISGDTVVVGARLEDSNATGVNGNQNDNNADAAGAVYVFTRSGTDWSQQAYLKASNAEAGDNFGFSVAISGDTVVVGAPWESSNATGVNGDQSNNSASSSGAAYVFVRDGTTWSQQAYLKASNTLIGDWFGWSVAIHGDTAVVGAIHEDYLGNIAGSAYVFARSGTDWSQQAYLKASNASGDAYFGWSVSVSGDTAVIGAHQEGGNGSGAAYIFTRSGITWSQQAYLKASNPNAYDRFGHSVAIDGDTLVVGAVFEDSNATGVNGNQSDNSALYSGAAYVFTRSGTDWSQQAYLKASNTEAGDYFGRSVAISGDTVMVGALFEDSNATGVNGIQTDNTAVDSGAVYIFTRSGTTWSQQAYLKASNTGEKDWFGHSVSISGDTLVVGAHGEDSNVSGVNGNQTNNLAKSSGAAYVFYSPTTTQTSYRSIGAYDGHILEFRENTNAGGTVDAASTTFNLGDEVGDKQYRAILSFNTATLPDNAIITKVTLKIKRPVTGYLIGNNNPLAWGRGLKVDVCKTCFGSDPALQLGDFNFTNATNCKVLVGAFGGTPTAYWYSANILGTAFSRINKTGTTQFRLRFAMDDNNDNAADYMKFYSGNYPKAASRPTLIIEYYIP